MDDQRRFAPAVSRNKLAIEAAFAEFGLTSGEVLEVGAGTGEHAVHMLDQFPDLNWTGIEPNKEYRSSCLAWAEHENLTRRFTVKNRDLLADDWHAELKPFDIIYCANVFHIAPIEVMLSFFDSLPNLMTNGAKVALYGPYKRDGVLEPESNRAFDSSLRERDDSWGIRDLELDVMPLAERAGLRTLAIKPMPANNLFVVFSNEV